MVNQHGLERKHTRFIRILGLEEMEPKTTNQ